MASIDDRIEALTQSVELLTLDVRQTQGQLQTFGSHLQAIADRLNTAISAIETLAEIARSHDRRISNLESL